MTGPPAMESHNPPANAVAIWWLAIRPKTLSISVAPVILGSALAWADHSAFDIIIFTTILISALCIQIGTNLYNDAADYERGADSDERLGPKRATQQGWLSAKAIKMGALTSFSMAFICGIYLAWVGGTAIIIIGLLSILSGYAYTAGPKPIAYSPLGELFVLVFFGLVAVGGSYYLHSHTISNTVLIYGSSIGCIAAAILLINNYRDLEGDEKVNKLTLVHYIGLPLTRVLYTLLMLYPYLALLYLISDFNWPHVLPFLSLPLAIRLIYQFTKMPISRKLNHLLAQTAQLQLIYTLLISVMLISAGA